MESVNCAAHYAAAASLLDFPDSTGLIMATAPVFSLDLEGWKAIKDLYDPALDEVADDPWPSGQPVRGNTKVCTSCAPKGLMLGSAIGPVGILRFASHGAEGRLLSNRALLRQLVALVALHMLNTT
jgi:hypothetical protein